MHIANRGAGLEFEWDGNKARANLQKHRIDFADAATALSDERAIVIPDDESEEERYVVVGMDARRATRNERAQYLRKRR
ncbi:MAG: BrnT family toxin [Candidatus Binataceae bacterium]